MISLGISQMDPQDQDREDEDRFVRRKRKNSLMLPLKRRAIEIKAPRVVACECRAFQ